MLRWGMCLALSLVACQPMYGGRPERLHPPEHHKPPEGGDQVAAIQIKYIDDCDADFRGDPKKVHAQPAVARPLVEEGDTALQSAEHEKDDHKEVALVKEAIDKYHNALVKDPFNIEATLQLAVAYDKAARKGCALAMLKRLGALSNNPKFANEANRDIDSIDATPQWFKDYRKDAMAAVGR